MNLLISYFDLNPSVLCGIGNNKILLRQERIIWKWERMKVEHTKKANRRESKGREDLIVINVVI